MVIEGGLGAEAEDDDQDGAMGADVRDGGEVFEAAVVGCGEVGEVCAAAFGSSHGPTGKAVVGGGGGGGWVEVGE